MKNIFKLSLLALFIGFTSCEDATDIIQESELNDEAAFQTVQDLQSGLNGVYAAYGPDFGGNGDGDMIVFNDLFTDNIKRGLNSSGQGNQEYSFILQPNTGFPNTLWSNRYATINFANRVLRAFDRLSPEFDATEMQTANRIKAQLLALRALCHFDLLQYFTPDYSNPQSPSVIIMDFVPELSDIFPRNTAGEVFEFVNNDLDTAADLIGSTNSGDIFYVNQDVIKAIKARVALFEGNYELAGTLAGELIADYPLVTNAVDFEAIWDDTFIDEADSPAAGREVIFALARIQGDNDIAGNFYANETTIDGSPFYEMSNQLYDLYPAADARKSIWVDATSDLTGSDRIILIDKYKGGPAGLMINHVKLFRTAEMYFIRAEVEARAGNLTGAATSIQQLRAKRFATAPAAPVFTSQNEALAEILLERRKELCFEGHRYLDLKRLGGELGIGINRDPRDCASFSAPCDLLANDYRFTLPIPLNETSPNPTIEQNPGY